MMVPMLIAGLVAFGVDTTGCAAEVFFLDDVRGEALLVVLEVFFVAMLINLVCVGRAR